MLRLIERKVHELGEGDPSPGGLDAIADEVDQLGVALGAETLEILGRAAFEGGPRSVGQRQRRTSLRQA